MIGSGATSGSTSPGPWATHEYCGAPGAGPSRTNGWASTGGGYYDYFGGNGGWARPNNASYYSFNVLLAQGGHWHVVVLGLGLRRLQQPTGVGHAQLWG